MLFIKGIIFNNFNNFSYNTLKKTRHKITPNPISNVYVPFLPLLHVNINKICTRHFM